MRKKIKNQMEETKKLRKKKTAMSSTGRTSSRNLPTEIMDKIFLSLPVETLFRLRFVIRDYSRFHNPNFIKMHLNQQFELENTSTATIIIASTYSMFKVDLDSLSKPPIRLHIPFRKRNIRVKFVGSCNGLLCLITKEPEGYIVYLLNPVTGEFKKSPVLLKSTNSIPVLGFGYDHISCEFKVLARRTTGIHKYEAIVHKMGTSTTTWRSIGELQYHPLLGENSHVFEGCPHWIWSGSNSNSKTVVVSFSVGTETFKEIPMPPIDYSRNPVGLTLLGGRLSMFHSVLEQKRYEFWVRMDDGWTKQLSFNFSDINGCRYMYPWGFKNGQVLLASRGGLALFNPVNGDVRELNFLHSNQFIKISPFVEGLGMLAIEDEME